MTINLKVKPLSVNECWKGQRFKTDLYRGYEKGLLYRLPPINRSIDFNGKLKISIEFMFSSVKSDIDNGVKPLLDILQKKYGFNDAKVFELIVKKSIVEKGSEGFKIQIENIK